VLPAVLGLCCLFAAPARAEPAGTAHGLIVKLKDDTATAADRGGRLQRVLQGAQLDRGLGAAHLRSVGRSAQLVRFQRALTREEAQAAIERLQQQGEVEWAVPNEREHRLQVVVPNDPLFPASPASSGQWWLSAAGGSNANAIDARLRGVPGIQTAWSTTTGNATPVVAVLYTGTTVHPELSGHLVAGYDFVSNVDFANDGDARDADSSDPGDWLDSTDKSKAEFADCDQQNSSWHGTTIAGMVAAATNNALGVAGISWNGAVLSVRVAGKCGAEVADIVDGMRWAAGLHVANVPDNAQPARVINISFGSEAACNAAYQDAINELHGAGAVVVAAAGNAHAGVYRPANCAGVIAVAALNRDGFKASYSNFGPQVTVSTVGGDDNTGAWGSLLTDGGLLVLSNSGTRAPGAPSYEFAFGTSFAVPVVSGTIGLMLAVNPALSADQIVAGLRASARPHVMSGVIGACTANNPGRCICSTATCGAGILDAPEALRYASSPASYVAPNWPLVNIDSPEVLQAVKAGPDLPPPSTPSGGGGGGGALEEGSVCALAAFALLAGVLRRRPASARRG